MGTDGSTAAQDGGGGLQAERTRLAWRRTTLAATVVTLLGVVHAATGAARPGITITLFAVAWLAIVAVAHRRIRVLGRPSTPDGADPKTHREPAWPEPAARRAPAALALLAAALALLGMALVGTLLLGPLPLG